MKAAVVETLGENPTYRDFREPEAKPGEAPISVVASALSNLVRNRAAGTHYSSEIETPFVVGVDGVGRLEDGQPVYFFSPDAPFGAMAERAVVPPSRCTPVPDGLDLVKAAALANPGMSSMAALRYRANFTNGERVLINGATGVSGRMAVQIARRVGAGRVIATGRNAEVLASLKAFGADDVLSLSQDREALENAFIDLIAANQIDVVLDYVWGDSAQTFFAAVAKASKSDRPIRFVQIGSMSAPTIPFPASVLRSSGLMVTGSGIGSVSTDNLVASIAEVYRLETSEPFVLETEAVPLDQVSAAWTEASAKRIVFVTE